MTDEPVISISEVGYSYGESPVLDDVSLDVDEGELVGLVGPNGAGKSTLLRVVSGVLSPDRGQVVVAGSSIDQLGSKATSRHLAVVPQSTTVSFSFDVRDIVEMGRHPYRSRFGRASTEDRRIVREAMERTEVTELADRPIDSISGGERQRVILARAIAQDTPALLLDEPTNNLDVNHQIETLETVRAFVDEGRSGLAAIHDLGLAARYCDRIALLTDGRLVDVGPPKAVLSSDRIRSAFGTDAAVQPEPITDSVHVTALPDIDETEHGVHVLGHGDPAARLVGHLGRAGCSVTAGPVPEGDRVVPVVEAVGTDIVTTSPYARLGHSTIRALEALVADADAVVVPAVGLPDGYDRAVDAALRADRLLIVDGREHGEPTIDGKLCDRGRFVSIESLLDAIASPEDERPRERAVPAEPD